jgi:hypothetical protein
MPCLASTVTSPQVFAPPAYFQASGGQCRIRIRRARNRVEGPDQRAGDDVVRPHIAGGEPYPSPVCDPMMSRFSKTRPGLLDGPPSRRSVAVRMSTVPFRPNVLISSPFFALISRMPLLVVTISRRSVRSRLSQ